MFILNVKIFKKDNPEIIVWVFLSFDIVIEAGLH